MIDSKLLWLKKRQLELTNELVVEQKINSIKHQELTNELRQLLNQIQQEETWNVLHELANKTADDYLK